MVRRKLRQVQEQKVGVGMPEPREKALSFGRRAATRKNVTGSRGDTGKGQEKSRNM